MLAVPHGGGSLESEFCFKCGAVCCERAGPWPSEKVRHLLRLYKLALGVMEHRETKTIQLTNLTFLEPRDP